MFKPLNEGRSWDTPSIDDYRGKMTKIFVPEIRQFIEGVPVQY